MLLDIAEKAKTLGDTYQPGSAVSAVRVLCELDGNIGPVCMAMILASPW